MTTTASSQKVLDLQVNNFQC